MNVSSSSSFHRHLNTLLYRLNRHATLSKAFDKSRKTPVTSSDGLVDVRKNPMGENLTDYWSEDYYRLSI